MVTQLFKMVPFGHQTFFMAKKVTKLAQARQRSHFTDFYRKIILLHGYVVWRNICKEVKMSQKKWQTNFFLPRKLYQKKMRISSWLVSPPFLHQRSASLLLSRALGLPPHFSPTRLSIPYPPAQNKPSTWASFDIPSCAESLG